jgi:nitrate reductase delta subunit
MMPLLKLISLLLEYPDEDLWQHREELLAATEQAQPDLLAFVQRYLAAPVLDKQAEWCALFERGRATSLLLFEHVHAQSRERGQAMVDLLNQYEAAGLQLSCRELPDYLPLYLEYLSLQEEAVARQGLQDVAPILALLGGRLNARDSEFGVLFDALLAAAQSPLRSDALAGQVAAEARDDSPAAMDAVWEEEQVKFMGSHSVMDNPCGDAPAQHAPRGGHNVLPQYLDLSAGGAK